MAIYNDPVHGSHWRLTPLEVAFVNHPTLLQLRSKRQLGLTDYVFTSGGHSRYMHSIGVGLSARRLGEALKLSKKDLDVLQAAAFIHDIGHTPFSHTVEAALGVHHESIPQRVLRGENYGAIDSKALLKTLADFDIDPIAVAETLAGNTPLSQFISHDVIDADRMDYLPRDLLSCNVGSIDLTWLYHRLMIINGELGVRRWAVRDLEQFMVTRARAYDIIYFHPSRAGGDRMLVEAVRCDPAFGSTSKADDSFAQAVHRMSDAELLTRLSNSESERTRELVKRILAGPSAWYPVVAQLGGPRDIPALRRIRAAEKEIEAELTKHGMLCAFTTWKKHWFDGSEPPAFPVDDGTSLWDYPIARGAWYHVPDRIFVVLAPDNDPKYVQAANAILEQFSK